MDVSTSQIRIVKFEDEFAGFAAVAVKKMWPTLPDKVALT